MTSIEEVFEELNFPSSARLKRALTARGIPFDANEVDALTRGEAVRQVQAPRYTFGGKIAATDINSRWCVDLIDFTQSPSTNGETYILFAQDVFSRYIYTEALLNKSPRAVIAAFKQILNKAGVVVPKIVMSDGAAEFGRLFQNMLTSNSIMYEQKRKEDPRAMSAMDSAIGRFKKALARILRKQGTNDWAGRLQKVTHGQNNIANEIYLEGSAPKDVEDDKLLMFDLYKKNAGFLAGNQRRMMQRADKLEKSGFFRATDGSKTKFNRGWKPTYEATVRQVDDIQGAVVTDTSGKSYLTKFVLPVDGPASTTDPVMIEQGGSVQTRNKQIRILQPFADGLKRYLDTSGPISSHRVLNILQSVEGKRALTSAIAQAKLNKRSVVLNFLRLFLNMFKIDKRGNTMFVSSIEATQQPKAARLKINERGQFMVI